jgi:CDP-diacylglycerol--glycerol-3-phosphate 3-phosphatidyltransferase
MSYAGLFRRVPLTVTRLSDLVRVIPAWMPANLITGLRAILLIPIYFAYQASNYHLVIILFLLALITDLIDGLHARYRNQVSNIGKMMDPAADKILFFGLLFLAGPGRLSQHVIYTIFVLEIILILLATAIGPVVAFFFGVKAKLGANVFGKIKFWLEGISVMVLLVGLNTRTFCQVAEYLMWGAVVLAIFSIIFHTIALRRNGVD